MNPSRGAISILSRKRKRFAFVHPVTVTKAWSPYSRKDCKHVFLQPCPKEYIRALQVSIAKISCEKLLLSKHASPCEKTAS